MTAPTLGTRDTRLRQLMDDPDCDLAALTHTYAQFRVVNRLVAGWSRVYRPQLRGLLSPTTTTTLRLRVTGIDPDERAHAYASGLPAVAGVSYRRVTSAELVGEGARFDVVISNHLLHHLEPAELTALVSDSERLARRLVVHNDLARGRAAYAGYAVVSRPFGRRSFISIDGLRSIRRSYSPAELRALVPTPWRVQPQFPARLLLVRDGDGSESIAA